MLRQLDELPTLVVARLQVDAARFNQVMLLPFPPAHGFLSRQDWCLHRLLVISRFHVFADETGKQPIRCNVFESSAAWNFWVSRNDRRVRKHLWNLNLLLKLKSRLSDLCGGGHGNKLSEDHTISHTRLSVHGIRLMFGDAVI